MSEEAPPPPAKKGGRGRMILLVLPVVLVMAGAGIAGGLYAAGAFGTTTEKAPEEDLAKPRLVLKGEDPVAIAEKFGGGGEH